MLIAIILQPFVPCYRPTSATRLIKGHRPGCSRWGVSYDLGKSWEASSKGATVPRAQQCGRKHGYSHGVLRSKMYGEYLNSA